MDRQAGAPSFFAEIDPPRLRRPMESDSYIVLATANKDHLAQHTGYCVACLGHVTDVKAWIDKGKTAICPHCSIDAVVPANLILDKGKIRRRLQILRHWRKRGFGQMGPCRGAQHRWMYTITSLAGVR